MASCIPVSPRSINADVSVLVIALYLDVFICLANIHIAVIFTIAWLRDMAEFLCHRVARTHGVGYIYFTRIPISKDFTIGRMELLALHIPG